MDIGMQLHRTTRIAAGIEEVFGFFSDPKNLGAITPPEMGFQILASPDRALQAGDRITYRIRVNGVPLTWVTLITEWVPNRKFTDVQEKGPYAKWEHTHSFEETDGGVLMTDIVDYELPLAPLGRIFAGWWVRRQLAGIFDYRERVITRRFR